MDSSCGLAGRRRKVFAAERSERRIVHAEEREYSSVIMAKMSSMETRVSSSVMGAFFLFVDGMVLGGAELIFSSPGEFRDGAVGVPGRDKLAVNGVCGAGASKLCRSGT